MTYVARATDDSPDQLLTIQNNTEISVLPTLGFTARDLWNRELPHVVTQTVHGSHPGGPLLAAGGPPHAPLRVARPGPPPLRPTALPPPPAR